MSDTEMQTIYDEMIAMFGVLPDHKQEPIQFAHYVKLYQYYKSREV
jgi:hypothetical protein